MKSKTDLSGMWEFCLDGDKKAWNRNFITDIFRTRSHCLERPRRQKGWAEREKRDRISDRTLSF